MRRLTRRRFIRYAVVGGVGLLAAEAIAGALFYLRPNLWRREIGFAIPVGRNEVPAVGDPPLTDLDGRFHLVNTEDGVLAMWTFCTHGHCDTAWDETEQAFVCPCHGARFDRFGGYIGGPASRPLDLMSISFDDVGDLIIHTNDISQRERYEPSQATAL